MKPCRRCGGAKEAGRPGRVHCIECQAIVDPASAQLAAESARARRTAVREDRIGGTPPPLKRVFAKDCPPGMKWCNRCQDFRKRTSFGTAGAGKLGAYCIPCTRAYNRERHIKRTFGLEWHDYETLLAAQNERCAICKGRPRKHVLAVDHDHHTGEVRGLLCSKCNHRLLGSANDDPQRLRDAADYLESGFARRVLGSPRFVPGSAVAA